MRAGNAGHPRRPALAEWGSLVGGVRNRGARTPEHQQFADLLHRAAVQLTADSREQCLSFIAIVAADADLDELVRGQRDADLAQHRGRQAVLPDRYDGMQRMRARP